MHWSLRCIKHLLCQLFLCLCRFFFQSYPLVHLRRGCLIPLITLSWTGYFEAALRLVFPLFSTVFIGTFFVVVFVSGRPRARSLVMIFFRTKVLQMLSSGVIGKGKSLALQARSLRATWFPRESLTPPLKMLFSEISVASWPGN